MDTFAKERPYAITRLASQNGFITQLASQTGLRGITTPGKER